MIEVKIVAYLIWFNVLFSELYEPTGECLGEGSFGSVLTYKNKITENEYAVKVN